MSNRLLVKSRRKIRNAVIEQMETRRLLAAPGTGWSLSFADEFNGTTLDTSKWSMYLPWTSAASGDNRYHNSNYASYMMPDDLSISGGLLSLTTQKRDVTSANGTVFHYTESMITSNATFWQAYGYFEIRAKLPTGGGNWPAFWTLANGWPPESDIMEMWTSGSNHQGQYGMDSVWHDKWGANPSTAFHTFGMQWAPGLQNYYIDGVLNYSTTTGVPTSSMYMLLNSGVADVHKANFANVASGNLANTLQVDYVRVYSYNSASSPQIVNGEAEQSAGFNFWWGGAGYNTGVSRTGDKSISIINAGGAEQTITGLLPNTQYTYSGYAYTTTATGAYFGVKTYGGTEIQKSVTTSTWSRGYITFTTGATNTSAVVYCYNPQAGSNTYFDDMMFELTPVISPIADTGTGIGVAKSVPVSLSGGTAGTFQTFSATSSNTALVSNASLVFTGSGNSRTLTATPVAGVSGTTNITVSATDLFGTVVTDTYQLAVATATTINGTSGDDTIRLVRSGTLLNVFINNVTATPTASYTLASTTIVTVLGGAGNDTLIIDYSGGDPVPAGGIGYDGGANTDTLSILGSNTNDAVNIVNGSVTYGSDSITYSNDEALSIDFGGGTDSLFSNTPVTVPALTLKVSASGTVALTSGGTLPTNTILNVASGTFNCSGDSQTIDQLTGSGTVINGGGTLTVGANNGSSTFSGSYTGAGGITKVGTGTFILSGSNNFTGTVTLGNGATAGGNANGILRITKTAALNGVTLVNIRDNNSAYDIFQLDGSAGAIALPSTVLFSIAANNSGSGSTGATVIQNIAGTNSIAGALTLGSGGVGYGFASDAGSLTFSAAIPASSHALYLRGNASGSFTGDIAGTASINVIGPGTWTFSGSNSYSGSTTISGGTLRIGAGAAAGVIPGNISNSGTLTFNRSDNPTFSGIISGTGSVVQSGSGSITLSGANTYNGSTSVSSGTLILASNYNPSSILSTTGLSVASGAAVQLSATGIGRFYFVSSPSSTITDNGALLLSGSGTNSSIAAISGTGSMSLNAHTVNATGLISVNILNLSNTSNLTDTATGISALKNVSIATGSILDMAGTLRVPTSAGNSIVLSGSASTLRVGTLDLDGTSSALNWTGGTLEIDNNNPSVGTAQSLGTSLTVPNAAILLLTDTAGGAVTGTINVVNGGALSVSGSINPTGTTAGISVTGSGTLTVNTGGIVRANALNSTTSITNNGTLSTSLGGGISGVTGSGSLSITGGTLTSTIGLKQGTVSVSSTGAVIVATNGTITGTSRIGVFNITGTGRVDLTNNDLVIYAMSESAVRAFITSGFNNGDWAGNGLTSSTAQNDSNSLTALGYASNADLGLDSFSGISSLSGTDILVKYTYYGDADLSGTVTLEDFTQFLVGYQQSGLANWVNGDFDYSGTISLEDFTLFLSGYQGPNIPLTPIYSPNLIIAL